MEKKFKIRLLILKKLSLLFLFIFLLFSFWILKTKNWLKIKEAKAQSINKIFKIYNGSFEKGTNNWKFTNYSKGFLGIDSDNKYHGNKSMKIKLGKERSGNGDVPYLSCITQDENENPSFSSFNRNYFVNKEFTFAFWYKFKNDNSQFSDNSNVFLGFFLIKKSNTDNESEELLNLKYSEDWQLAYKTIKLGNINSLGIGLCLMSKTPEIYSVWIDNVVVYPSRLSAIIEGNHSLAVDYSSSYNEKIAILNKGHSLSNVGDVGKTIFLPRILKSAYKHSNDEKDLGFDSEIIIMNTEDKETHIDLKIYPKDGMKVYSFTLPPFGFKIISTQSYSDWPTDPVDPPAIINSDTEIAVDVNLINSYSSSYGERGGSYEGISEKTVSKKWYVPIILRNAYNEGWETGIIIQNAINEPANLSISLNGLDNNYKKECNISLPGNGQKIIYFPNTSYNECFQDLINKPDYNNNKKFSAVINSDKNIAVVLSHSSASKRKLIEENAIPDKLAGSKIFVPRVYNNYYNWMSSFTIQNILSSENESENKKVNIIIKYVKKDGTIISSKSNDDNCYNKTIDSLKSLIVVGIGNNCFPQNDFSSAVISLKENDNSSLVGVYHLGYPQSSKDNSDLSIYKAAGATVFSNKDISTKFFIPQIYFDYNNNKQTGVQIQNADEGVTNFNFKILNEKGEVLAEKKNISLNPYQPIFYYIPNFLLQDVAQADDCISKNYGDVNCDGSVNESDYIIWKCEFLGNGSCSDPVSNLTADFNLNNKIDLGDFEIWRSGREAILR
ncbi:MAG: hypothetical protein N2482_03260 [Patescibacteria group bacterium]|nr:hypothetical protein [Patescibacteria group bacterium]